MFNTINQFVAYVVYAVSNYKSERRTIKELNQLSDRDLADIGISRCDIPSIAKYESDNKSATSNKLSGWAVENA